MFRRSIRRVVQYAPQTFSKDGKPRAPRILVGPHRQRIFPLPVAFILCGGMIYGAKRQYDQFMLVPGPKRFLQKIQIVPYGVLGTVLSMTGTLRTVTDSPDEMTVIVDPAGLHHIKGVADGAGGASGAIYKHFGIKGEFPSEVKDVIHGPCDAKMHEYAGHNIIHCVGPDFRQGSWTEREASLELSRAYRNILHEFVKSDAKVLRMLPVSSGIFSGDLYNQMPPLTQEALSCGFEQLHSFDQEAVLARGKRVELCIFMEREWDTYCKAFDYIAPPQKL